MLICHSVVSCVDCFCYCVLWWVSLLKVVKTVICCRLIMLGFIHLNSYCWRVWEFSSRLRKHLFPMSFFMVLIGWSMFGKNSLLLKVFQLMVSIIPQLRYFNDIQKSVFFGFSYMFGMWRCIYMFDLWMCVDLENCLVLITMLLSLFRQSLKMVKTLMLIWLKTLMLIWLKILIMWTHLRIYSLVQLIWLMIVILLKTLRLIIFCLILLCPLLMRLVNHLTCSMVLD